MSIDEPMDLEAVAADDALVERLRRSLSPHDAVVWGDDEDDSEDLSYALLHALQSDVSAELPPAPALPATVVPLASRRRALGRTATVTAIAAGVLSLAGASAAATSSPGDPLYGMRSAVASAVQEVVDAITPAAPIGPVQNDPAAAATPTATVSPPGAAVSAAARSASAVRQIQERLTTADRLLDDGRAKPAGQVLDQAERRLPLVLDTTVRKSLQDQINALRARASAMLATPPSTKPQPERSAPPRRGDKGNEVRPEPDSRKATPKPERSAAANRGSGGGSSQAEDEATTEDTELDDRSGKARVPDVVQDARDGRSGPGRRDVVDR